MRKFLSLMLILCIAWAAIAVPASASDEFPFTDVPDEPWYYNYLRCSVQRGFFSGTSATTFSPERGITRAEAVAVLARVHKEITGEQTIGDAPATFKDVSPNSYYAKAVGWATENHIVSGYGNGIFGPNRVVTRAEIAVMFHRYLELIDQDGRYQLVEDAYKDLAEFPGWAKPHIEAISGFEIFWRSTFSPSALVTRGDATELFVRLYEKATFPVDNETPRIKFRYHPRVDDETGTLIDPNPLGDNRQKIIQSYEEYTELVAHLQESMRDCDEVPQPEILVLSEEFFDQSNLLAFDILESGSPQYDCEFAGSAVSSGCVEVTLTESGIHAGPAGATGVLFLLPVSKDVTSVEVTRMKWTDYAVWMPL